MRTVSARRLMGFVCWAFKIADLNSYQRKTGAYKLDVCGSSQNEYGRIRMVETFCPRVIQTYLLRSLGIDIIILFPFLSASVESFHLNNPISCGTSVEQI